MQSHIIILWAEARNEGMKSILDRTYALLTAFREYGPELSPNYIKAYHKKDAKPYDWTYETLGELLRKGLDKRVFPDLGYTIGFFSSFNDDEAAGISITTGVANRRFKNTLRVDLPLSLPIYDNPSVIEKLMYLFKKIVCIFDPFWGCIVNDINIKRYNGYWRNLLPTTVHWVNFFGESIVKELGIERIKKAQVHTVKTLNKGFFMRVKEFPIDDFSKEDLDIQVNINKYFGFKS